ncbi:unnamed protein product [Paramecium sonneborni]|uniref:Uncharacterized protein n=1 Tax=Paramecium sonneborni TaxID=65129 RepID=A0A8S1NA31_9CILI|nr:unnamed protein product [Paramecium sonneborni]
MRGHDIQYFQILHQYQYVEQRVIFFTDQNENNPFFQFLLYYMKLQYFSVYFEIQQLLDDLLLPNHKIAPPKFFVIVQLIVKTQFITFFAVLPQDQFNSDAPSTRKSLSYILSLKFYYLQIFIESNSQGIIYKSRFQYVSIYQCISIKNLFSIKLIDLTVIYLNFKKATTTQISYQKHILLIQITQAFLKLEQQSKLSNLEFSQTQESQIVNLNILNFKLESRFFKTLEFFEKLFKKNMIEMAYQKNS